MDLIIFSQSFPFTFSTAVGARRKQCLIYFLDDGNLHTASTVGITGFVCNQNRKQGIDRHVSYLSDTDDLSVDVFYRHAEK